MWGHENNEQIEIWHRNFSRRVLRGRESVPKALILTYGELEQQKLNFRIWQSMIFYWNKFFFEENRFVIAMLSIINSNDYENKRQNLLSDNAKTKQFCPGI